MKLCFISPITTISGNGISKLFLTIAAAFAEAERDRIRERIGQVKADQRARGRYLGGSIPYGYRLVDEGELVPHEAEQGAIRGGRHESAGAIPEGHRGKDACEGASGQPRGRAGHPQKRAARVSGFCGADASDPMGGAR